MATLYDLTPGMAPHGSPGSTVEEEAAPVALADPMQPILQLLTQGLNMHATRLDAAGVLDLEPRLAGRLVGGLHIRSDHQVHPRRLVAALLATLRGCGVVVREDTPVNGLVRGDGGWSVVARCGATDGDETLIVIDLPAP